MSDALTRRQIVAGLSASLLLPSCGLQRQSPLSDLPFAHGVASGDPDVNSVVIWTRVSVAQSTANVGWEVATDPDFNAVVRSGQLLTGDDRDHTVKVLVERLQPGGTYYYRFRLGSDISQHGRTRTLPVGGLGKLGIAMASCSNVPFGFFNAYEAIANDDAIDVVLHLGDYIYEYGIDGYGGATGRSIGRNHRPPHETISLADYRIRHAQYKADPQSQMMHAAHPLIAIWDDHESANNPWMRGAENHDPSEGSWARRRAVSLRAYYEWMPVRDPATPSRRQSYWRHYRFGDLASLVTLETRHTGRAKQFEYVDHIDAIQSQSDAARFIKNVLGEPNRRMLSPECEEFVVEALDDSLQSGVPWRLIGNQIPMARTCVPPLDDPLFANRQTDDSDPVAAELAKLQKMGRYRLPIYLDTWDGYDWAREAFYRSAKNVGATDLLVLTGDSHSFWANKLRASDGDPMGLEIGTAGITSPGDFVAFGDEGAKRMDRLLAKHNDEIVWTDGRHPGYVRLVLERDQGSIDYLTVTDILSQNYQVNTLKSKTIKRGEGQLTFA